MKNNAGFTLLEIAVVTAIIAILAAAAVMGYQHYTDKAASTELIEQYDELRQRAELAVGEGTDLCADPEAKLSPGSVLYSPHAELSIIKEDPDIIGLHIKADMQSEGAHNTDIVREAHNLLNKSKKVAAGAVVTDSVVSFVAVLVKTPCTSAAVSPASSAPIVAAPPPPPPPPPPAAPTNTTTTVDAKPSKEDHPCEDGYVFTPDPGQTTFPMTGKCEKDSKNRSDPYAPVQCHVCSGPPVLCERLHHEETCEWPNNICINHMVNEDTGARTVERKCGNRQDAFSGWWNDTSSFDRCLAFDPKFVTTYDYECTFACTGDNCNKEINPVANPGTKKTMYNPN